MRYAGGVYVGECWRGTQIGVGQAVVPSQCILVPHGPQKPHEKSAGGKHITHAAPKHLPRLRRFAGKADDMQATQHHARSCSPENREESEILQVNNYECRDAYGCAQLAECKLPAKRTKECEEATIRKKQAAGIYQSGNPALVDRG